MRVGGLYQVGLGHIEVDSVALVPFSSISATDVRSSGEQNLEELRRRAAHAGPIEDDTWLYRIQFHVVDADHEQAPKKRPVR